MECILAYFGNCCPATRSSFMLYKVEVQPKIIISLRFLGLSTFALYTFFPISNNPFIKLKRQYYLFLFPTTFLDLRSQKWLLTDASMYCYQSLLPPSQPSVPHSIPPLIYPSCDACASHAFLWILALEENVRSHQCSQSVLSPDSHASHFPFLWRSMHITCFLVNVSSTSKKYTLRTFPNH